MWVAVRDKTERYSRNGKTVQCDVFLSQHGVGEAPGGVDPDDMDCLRGKRARPVKERRALGRETLMKRSLTFFLPLLSLSSWRP